MERQWMCIKSEEILQNSKSYKITHCRNPMTNNSRIHHQKKGFHCVQETPDPIKEVEQSSYANFSHRYALIDSDPNSCTKTEKKNRQFFTLHLSSVQIVKYAQVLGSFSSGEYPRISVFTMNRMEVFCDLCLVDRDPHIRWSYFCPENAIGDIIYVQDRRENSESFQLCTIHLFLQLVPTTTTLQTETTLPITTATTSGPTRRTTIPLQSPEVVSTQLLVTESMISKNPSKAEGSLLPIVLGSSAGVLLSVLLVVCLVKKPVRSRRIQAPPEVPPDNHIYEDVSTMLRESVPPDILQDACSHIYAVPQDLDSSPNTKENEIYEESPVTSHFLNDGMSHPPCTNVDDEDVKNVENEIYAVN